MQHDDMIWEVINHQFCSFQTTIGAVKDSNKGIRRHFCKHPYSITGLCNKSHCPLANSSYAVVREIEGKISLYIKTVERAHSPKNLWERIDLSRNYAKALKQLDEHLMYYPKHIQHRNKQRLTKIHQYLIRMRKIELKKRDGKSVKLVRAHRKVEQREERREKKALVAAKIEDNIEKELVERLSRGTYGDIYNFPEVPYQKALQKASGELSEVDSEEESENEDEEDYESSEEEDGNIEYVEDLEEEEYESEEEDIEDIHVDDSYAQNEQFDSDHEQDSDNDSDENDTDNDDSDDESADLPPPKKKRKGFGTRIEIEYEDENQGPNLTEEIMNVESVPGLAW